MSKSVIAISLYRVDGLWNHLSAKDCVKLAELHDPELQTDVTGSQANDIMSTTANSAALTVLRQSTAGDRVDSHSTVMSRGREHSKGEASMSVTRPQLITATTKDKAYLKGFAGNYVGGEEVGSHCKAEPEDGHGEETVDADFETGCQEMCGTSGTLNSHAPMDGGSCCDCVDVRSAVHKCYRKYFVRHSMNGGLRAVPELLEGDILMYSNLSPPSIFEFSLSSSSSSSSLLSQVCSNDTIATVEDVRAATTVGSLLVTPAAAAVGIALQSIKSFVCGPMAESKEKGCEHDIDVDDQQGLYNDVDDKQELSIAAIVKKRARERKSSKSSNLSPSSTSPSSLSPPSPSLPQSQPPPSTSSASRSPLAPGHQLDTASKKVRNSPKSNSAVEGHSEPPYSSSSSPPPLPLPTPPLAGTATFNNQVGHGTNKPAGAHPESHCGEALTSTLCLLLIVTPLIGCSFVPPLTG